MPQVWTPTARLAVSISSGNDVVEKKNGNRHKRKNVNRARRVELQHAEQVEDHQYRED